MNNLERANRNRLLNEYRRAALDFKTSYPTLAGSFARHERELEDILTSMLTECSTTFGKRYLNSMKSAYPQRLEVKSEDGGKLLTENQLSNMLFKWAKKQSAKKVVGISNTTRNKVKSIIADAVANSVHPRQIAKDIQNTIGGDWGRSRALTIARTETHSASMYGEFTAVDEEGVMETKEWIATSDSRTREDHMHADGQVVDMDKSFNVGGEKMMFPGDPDGEPEQIINCRCTVSYGVK